MAELDWNEIVKAERPKLYAYAVNRTKNTDTALDLVQDVLLKAYRNREQFRGGNLGGWLQSIMNTMLIDHYRKASRRSAELLYDFQPLKDSRHNMDRILLESGKIDNSAEESYLDIELSKDIKEALSKVTPQFRECVELTCLRDMSLTDAAAHLGIPRSTVGSRKHKGLKQMRELLEA